MVKGKSFTIYYKRIDFGRLTADASNLDWRDFNNLSDVDAMIEVMNSNIMHLLNHHAPLRPYKHSDMNSTKPYG